MTHRINATFRRSLMLATTLSAVALTGTAMAQTAPAPSDATTVEEIVVTAQRRETRLQDTPVSITALTTESLEQRGITNLASLTNFAPNLEIHQTNRPAGGGSSFAAYIRGVGTGDFQFPTDPGVGLYVDDVYLARSVGGLLSLEDIERVEVLRGPQGTLFGRNTIGGAINVVTTRPHLTGDLEGVVRARVGEYGRKDIVAGVNGPIVDGVLGGKFTAAWLNSDGWGSGGYGGPDLNDEHRVILRGALLYQASDNLDVSLNLDYTDQNQHPPAGRITAFAPAGATIAKIARFNQYAAPAENARLGLAAGTIYDARFISNDPNVTNGLQPQYDDSKIGGGSVVLNWHPSDRLTFRSITAVRGISADIGVDGDQTPYSLQTSQTQLNQHQYSQEFQLSGTAFGDRLNFIVGAYLFNELGSSKLYTESFHGIWENIPVALRTNADAGDTQTYFSLNAKSYAIYGQATFAVSDKVDFTLGGRLNKDEKDYAFSVLFTQRNVDQVPFSRASAEWKSFSPKLGIEWRPVDHVMAYVSYSEGFKSGGFGSSNTPLVPTPQYEPEELAAYEIGVKTDWFDRRLTANLAVFQSQYDQIQLTIQSVDPVTNANLRTTRNAGSSRIKGFEAEFVARPVQDLSLNLNIGYVDAVFDTLLPAAITSGFKLGDRLPQVPDWSVTAGAQYVFHPAIGDITVRGDATYKGDQFLTAADATSYQDSYTLTNARLSFEPAAMPDLEIALQATNLGDQRYNIYQATLAPTGSAVAIAGPPRLVTLEARLRF
jgi:iron complex outermembrane receptor protein